MIDDSAEDKPTGSARHAKFPLRLERMVRAPKKLVGSDLASGAPAAGLGLDSEDVRRRMVERLRAAHPHDARVLQALARVPRHRFVDAALVTQSYEDTSLPIGHGQTISKPSVVARMLDVLMQGANAKRSGHLGRVLEIGTGCGYQAAVLCSLGRQVVSVERIRGLYDKASINLAALGLHQLRLVYGDGMLGHPPNAPYDSIIAAACGTEVPPCWLAQLAEGGRLIAPIVGKGTQQALVVVDRTTAGYLRSEHEAVQFVPLKSGSV